MAKYRHQLPQLAGDIFLTDGGIETTLIFHEGLELPDFAAFHLLKNPRGTAALEKYFKTYAGLAKKHGIGCVLESATWRSSPDWGEKLGYSSEDLRTVNQQAIEMLHAIREQFEARNSPMVVSGCIGPRGDGYNPENFMTAEEAEAYHAFQAAAFRDAEADMITAITMTYANEAIGLARAARNADMPVVLSFTLETDGRLPSGQSLQAAIEEVDDATESAPAYYMINCAHPTHFAETMEPGAPWVSRIRGLRTNASKRSHQELNDAPDLDEGDPEELGRDHLELLTRMPNVNVFGGCCGTDHRHIDAICSAVLAR